VVRISGKDVVRIFGTDSGFQIEPIEAKTAFTVSW